MITLMIFGRDFRDPSDPLEQNSDNFDDIWSAAMQPLPSFEDS